MVARVNMCCAVLRLMDVLKQLATCQPGLVTIEMLKVAAKRGMGMMEPLETVEAWRERQGAPATPKDL